ncbi:MAG: iron uptake porin, partial [Pseudanabaenaceae cyanobacterium bins.68]|nr:iron uptake porin [Pseudanabaenaceae cyanobacterium bins.68]
MNGKINFNVIGFCGDKKAKSAKFTEKNTEKTGLALLGWGVTCAAMLVDGAIANPSILPQADNSQSIDQSIYILPKRIERVSQVTSVSQLSDVKATDWAFSALQSLVERYGCVAGYPDQTFRGQRAITRYEFAAGLNACLDKLSELLNAGLAGKVSREDLATLQRLQEEFATELAALKGRVNVLEEKTTQLEAQQFSTTTKLSGLGVFNVTGASGGNGLLRETGVRDALGRPATETIKDNPNVTLSGLIWLTFQTSFTGKDSLITQLAAGNGNSPANTFFSAGTFNAAGVPYFDQTSGTNSNQFVLRELSYSFPIGAKTKVIVGPRLNVFKYFDDNAVNIFDGGSFNSTNNTYFNQIRRGAGVVVTHAFADWLDSSLGYLAESNEFFAGNDASNPRKGLTGGTNVLAAELTFKPAKNVNLRFLYARNNLESFGGQPLYGVLDDGRGGAINNAQSNIYNFNFDWLVTKGIGLFGRYSYNSTNVNAAIAARSGEITANAYQIGLFFPDLFKAGAKAFISYVVPNQIKSGSQFFVSGAGNGATQQELE